VGEEGRMCVIILTRDGRGIEPCLSSVRESGKEFGVQPEVSVVSDVPSEELKKLCEKYGANYMVFKATPSKKRNYAVEKTDCDLLVFCDDDVVVPKNWLRDILHHFRDGRVAVVGGPNINPPDSTLRERCSGYIFESFFGGAGMAVRYRTMSQPFESRTGEEFILCNMAVRRSVFDEVGGFPENLYPCEENYLCYTIKEKGYKLVYEPRAFVWHKRRPLFIPHAKQVFNYGLARAKMMRMLGKYRPLYFLPSVFVVGLIAGAVMSIFIPIVRVIYLVALTIYTLMALASSVHMSIKHKDPKAFFLLFPGFFVHHAAYGLGFIKGLFAELGESR